MARKISEQEHAFMWTYDIPKDSRLQVKGLRGRRRGGGAFVEYERNLPLSYGGIGGHGAYATTTGYLDVYDSEINEWPASPERSERKRSYSWWIIKGKLCVAGGRGGGAAHFWNATVAPIDGYNFAEKKWEMKSNLP